MTHFITFNVAIKTFSPMTSDEVQKLVMNAIWDIKEFRNVEPCGITIDSPQEEKNGN